jgi:hypothetical protein
VEDLEEVLQEAETEAVTLVEDLEIQIGAEDTLEENQSVEVKTEEILK